MMTRLSYILLLAGLCMSSLSSHAGWSDWWQTPEQRAAKALQRGDVEELKKVAPDTNWQAIGEYESENYDAASQTFNQAASEHRLNGDESMENDALYNQGVSQVRNGQYQEAIDNFDSILERNPDFVDAEHNRQIAQKLMQLQQQQQQSDSQQGDGDNQNNQNGSQQPQSEDGEQQSQSGGQPESSEEQQSQPQGEPSNESADQSGGSDQQQENEPESGDDEQEQRDAEQALAAEAAREEQQSDRGEQSRESESVELPMSEADQAAEQMLRRIPDDPAGLLRRKLMQSHRSQYPEVGDARQPW